MEDNYSKLEWNGIKSNRFAGGRKHIFEPSHEYISTKEKKHFESPRNQEFSIFKVIDTSIAFTKRMPPSMNSSMGKSSTQRCATSKVKAKKILFQSSPYHIFPV